ncbi:hypothetical protein ACBI99_14160 [Nonomuraea sp. ATR24]|uniref:hypothetical protein n=1 Tax=Nonomuraea sp. ATR24 TaxID=1676744 RepID=UPI0035C03022
MLKNHLRQDLQWLRRQARKDRRITLTVLAMVSMAWVRQLVPGAAPPASAPLLALSAGLLAFSAAGWLVAAFFVARAGRRRGREPVEALRWAGRISRAKEWAFGSLAAYVAWHVLQFVTALLLA